jgi:hypothetical protein
MEQVFDVELHPEITTDPAGRDQAKLYGDVPPEIVTVCEKL